MRTRAIRTGRGRIGGSTKTHRPGIDRSHRQCQFPHQGISCSGYSPGRIASNGTGADLRSTLPATFPCRTLYSRWQRATGIHRPDARDSCSTGRLHRNRDVFPPPEGMGGFPRKFSLPRTFAAYHSCFAPAGPRPSPRWLTARNPYRGAPKSSGQATPG